jgi:dTDP-4-dehydrorhamnose reductase
MTSAKTNTAVRPILLLGSAGQLGATLRFVLGQVGKVIAADRAMVDLTNLGRLREFVRESQPSIIVNAAAYTAVDKAESEPDLAGAVNAMAPAALADTARDTDALLIHYSTDYVFDGSKPSAYVESDPVNPLNVYGTTKAQGEAAISH